MLKFEHFENVHLICTHGPPFQISKYATACTECVNRILTCKK